MKMEASRHGKTRWVAFLIGLFLGALSWHGMTTLLSKADLMHGNSRYERLGSLISIVRDIGVFHFQPCSRKVNRMHRIISEANDYPSEAISYSKELEPVIASIIIDGDNCIDSLLRHVDSRVPIPGFSMYIGFLGNVGPVRYPEDIGALLHDERSLVLWILDKIDCKIYSLMGQCPCFQEDDPECIEELEEYRSALVTLWKENR